MRIAQLSNLYETVPPKTYGGIERVVYDLTEELIKRGHEVTLFASGGSQTSAKLIPITPAAVREMNLRFPEMYSLLAIKELIRQSGNFDIIHSHMTEWAVVFDGIYKAPLVTTLHGRLDVPEFQDVYHTTLGTKLVSVSDSQRKPAPDLNYVATVYNGVAVEDFPYSDKEGEYLAFLGRISPEKGTHLAIEVARKLGEKLVIAAKVDNVDSDYFKNKIKPFIDGKQIKYIGEIGYKDKGEFLKKAKALLALIQWEEPFGLFFIEAMATGTPVIAWRKGSVPEIIADGQTGFIVDSVGEAAAAVKKIGQINRRTCREHVEENFTAAKMTDGYEAVYRKILGQ